MMSYQLTLILITTEPGRFILPGSLLLLFDIQNQGF
jgi:hypothetical protein